MGKKQAVTEEECWRMAGLSYRRQLAEKPSERLAGWLTLPLEGGRLHNPPTGFDAACFVHPERRCIVAAYRGTGEGSGPRSWASWLADLAADASLIALPEWAGDTAEKWLSDDFLRELMNQVQAAFRARGFAGGSRRRASADPAPDQFRFADDLASTLIRHYPDHRLRLTGFSLGGALAAHAAAVHGLEAVTFASPSCYWQLPSELNRPEVSVRAAAGIRNYTHPCDCVGAGPFGEYPHGIGRTYYLGEGYAKANEGYESHPWRRIYDSFFGEPLYHSLEHFRFTPEGSLEGPLVEAKREGEGTPAGPLVRAKRTEESAPSPEALG